MKIYLDNCCFNRPFDDQRFIKIKLETEAKLYIQEKIKLNEYQIVWSYILDFENSVNPFEERKEAIRLWKDIAVEDIKENLEIKKIAKEIVEFNVKSKDALHVACAVFSNCNYFLTTDNSIIKRISSFRKIKVINPIEFINEEVKHGNK